MLRTLAALVLAACAPSTQPAPNAPDAAPASSGAAPDAAQPGSPPPCTGGQAWFTPAGDDNALPASGCYTPCDAAACPAGQVCKTVITNPCGPTADGQVKTCMQAGQQSQVCLSG